MPDELMEESPLDEESMAAEARVEDSRKNDELVAAIKKRIEDA